MRSESQNERELYFGGIFLIEATIGDSEVKYIYVGMRLPGESGATTNMFLSAP